MIGLLSQELFLQILICNCFLLFIQALRPVAADLIVTKTNATRSHTFLISTEFSDLINTNVNVVVDSLRVIFEEFDRRNNSRTEQVNATQRGKKRYNRKEVGCTMTIHRNHCTAPRILNHERITWDTRICFQWKCFRTDLHQNNASLLALEHANNISINEITTSGFAMRVENCWTGSIRNPIFILSKNGCTNERTMIASPKYSDNLEEASTHGWLSVRLAGTTHIRLACAIRICDVCDPRCSLITPPSCMDHNDNSHERIIWKNKELIDSRCATESIDADGSNSANAETFNDLFKFFHIIFTLFSLKITNVLSIF